MIIEFSGELFYWRGPSPYHFVRVPEEPSLALKAISRLVTYGWGVIPVWAQTGRSEWKTTLFPKNGLYLVPLRDDVREAEDLELGDEVKIRLEVRN